MPDTILSRLFHRKRLGVRKIGGIPFPANQEISESLVKRHLQRSVVRDRHQEPQAFVVADLKLSQSRERIARPADLDRSRFPGPDEVNKAAVTA
jgi:hypothetical protein